MKANFEACLAEVLTWEGGWSDHPSDPGGATMKGITLATYRQWKPGASKAQLKAITDAEVRAIYKQGYWDVVQADDLPPGLDLVAFDAAVNSGPMRSAKWLQGALGVAPDGKIGPQTLAAAQAADPHSVILAACSARLNFVRGLSTWPVFGKGWQRRIDGVRAKALEMAKTTVYVQPVQPTIWEIIAAWFRRVFGG